jgi:hypothetical protein
VIEHRRQIADLAFRRGQVDRQVVIDAREKLRIDDPTAVAGVKQEGGDA